MHRRRRYPCAVRDILLTGKAVILPVILLDEIPDNTFPFCQFRSHIRLPLPFWSNLLHITVQEYHRTNVNSFGRSLLQNNVKNRPAAVMLPALWLQWAVRIGHHGCVWSLSNIASGNSPAYLSQACQPGPLDAIVLCSTMPTCLNS